MEYFRRLGFEAISEFSRVVGGNSNCGLSAKRASGVSCAHIGYICRIRGFEKSWGCIGRALKIQVPPKEAVAFTTANPSRMTASNNDSPFEDLRSSLLRRQLWTALAWEDLRQQYHRTLFGVVWISFSFGLFCLVKIFIFGALSSTRADFFAAYVVLGYIVWQFISGTITDGCRVFTYSRSWIKGVALPLPIFVFQTISRHLIIAGFSAISGILILVLMGYPQSLIALSSLLAIPALLFAAVPVQLLLGTICAAARDAGQLVATLMRILFFATPIVWVPTQDSRLELIAKYNVFTYFIDIFRAPITENRFPGTSWLVVLAVTAILWIVAMIVYRAFRYRIPYWV